MYHLIIKQCEIPRFYLTYAIRLQDIQIEINLYIKRERKHYFNCFTLSVDIFH